MVVAVSSPSWTYFAAAWKTKRKKKNSSAEDSSTDDGKSDLLSCPQSPFSKKTRMSPRKFPECPESGGTTSDPATQSPRTGLSCSAAHARRRVLPSYRHVIAEFHFPRPKGAADSGILPIPPQHDADRSAGLRHWWDNNRRKRHDCGPIRWSSHCLSRSQRREWRGTRGLSWDGRGTLWSSICPEWGRREVSWADTRNCACRSENGRSGCGGPWCGQNHFPTSCIAGLSESALQRVELWPVDQRISNGRSWWFDCSRGTWRRSDGPETPQRSTTTSLSEVTADHTSLSEVTADHTSLSDVIADHTSLSDVIADQTSLSDVIADHTSLSDVIADHTSLSDVTADVIAQLILHGIVYSSRQLKKVKESCGGRKEILQRKEKAYQIDKGTCLSWIRLERREEK